MPPQAVTLEPLVQGERSVETLRLLGRAEHAHRSGIATFLWYEISAQGTDPLANTSEKFGFQPAGIGIGPAVRTSLFELVSRSFRYAALFNQRLLNRLLQ